VDRWVLKQEVESPAARAMMNNQLTPLGYESFFPKPGPAKSVPISWRDRYFALVKSGHGVPLDQIYVTQGVAHSQEQQLPKNGSDHNAYRARVAW
jgi:hypothetical protein